MTMVIMMRMMMMMVKKINYLPVDEVLSWLVALLSTQLLANWAVVNWARVASISYLVLKF